MKNVKKSADEKLRLDLRNNILILLKLNVPLEKLAYDSRVPEKTLSQLIFPDTPEDEGVPKFELDSDESRSLNDITKRMIREINNRIISEPVHEEGFMKRM